MKLIKEATDKTVSNDIYVASSFLDATFGLLLKKNDDIYFKTRFGIHTFFMNRQIDVIIADKHMKIRKIRENLKPNRIFIWNPKYFNVFELRKGSAKKSRLKAGDRLKLL
jgi:uncharacterized membrane protein (UPF0127 family)